ncbi:hypothetical protein PR002_g27555 [Phytophthora rubi]|uniref:DDE Tnp4 domain-containing protein n=1 Tax=Phytophthora rubi TaxID=129364 RepID=A0A6A3HG79_9STRA|nr:hypothetical protein PR002_g27555 [Phytophthora rubi]
MGNTFRAIAIWLHNCIAKSLGVILNSPHTIDLSTQKLVRQLNRRIKSVRYSQVENTFGRGRKHRFQTSHHCSWASVLINQL